MWLIMAVLSAVFAGVTSILAKYGIQNTDSDIATALRTIVVWVFAWAMVFIVGSAGTLPSLDPHSLLFLVLSGLATGASWICYFKALSRGEASRVAAIDKSSTVLSVLLAIIFLQETSHLAVKLLGTLLLGTGIFLMAGKPEKAADPSGQKSWRVYAFLSAVFAALTSILAKIGITGVESNLGTAIRTGVVLIMAWVLVFAKGKQTQLFHIKRRELLYIALSGLATGASWLCYYYAIQNGVVSVVVPIDKMSLAVTVLLSCWVFGEKLNRKSLLGLGLMLLGTVGMAVFA
ncbi:MAG: EamA family transporter [Clostridia bacterium]|nr:EamA family transporter [Clostridia bacterium]